MLKEELLEELRLIVLQKEGVDVRSILLADTQVDLVEFISQRSETTASDIARIKNVTIQNASSKLSILHTKGYLVRTTRTADSGGIEHVYTAKQSSAFQVETTNNL